jgi:hypothetical protein
MMPIIFACD